MNIIFLTFFIGFLYNEINCQDEFKKSSVIEIIKRLPPIQAQFIPSDSQKPIQIQIVDSEESPEELDQKGSTSKKKGKTDIRGPK